MTVTDGVQASGSLAPSDTAAVLALVAESAEADGFAALNEVASLRLRHPRPGTTHLMVRTGGVIVGYGQVTVAALPHQHRTGKLARGALVVRAGHRRRGHGTALLESMLATSPYGLEIWAFQHTEAAQALAARVGLVPVRQLLIMKRSLAELVPTAEIPAGVRIRAFRPGRDEDGWLAVNGRAFADHPEQGGITRADLDDRMSDPWFDPEGFLVAEQAQGTLRQAQGTRLLGYHWTKQHPDHLGEVYVLGVDPDAGVRGLGRALLTAGLEHLRDAGNRQVELYTDAENTRAVALYQRNGFTVASSDVLYASPSVGLAPLATMHVGSDPPDPRRSA